MRVDARVQTRARRVASRTWSSWRQLLACAAIAGLADDRKHNSAVARRPHLVRRSADDWARACRLGALGCARLGLRVGLVSAVRIASFHQSAVANVLG